jgi:apolipoprotein N-acyltransferase
MQGGLPGPVRTGLAPVAGGLLALGFLAAGSFPLSLAGLALLIALALVETPGRAAIEGLVAGVVFYGVLLRWFAAAILDFSDLPVWIAAGAVLSSALVLGAGTAVICATLSRLSIRLGAGMALVAAPLLWVGHEVLRGVFPLPFPWAVLSAAAAPWGPTANAARNVGSVGISLALALGAATLAAVAVAPRRAWPAPLLWGLLCAGLLVGAPPSAGGERMTVAATQGSLSRGAHPRDKLDAYRALTAEAAAEGAQLVVWPESAVPYRLDEHPGYRRLVESLAHRHEVDLLVGTLTKAAEGERLHNSAALIRPGGGVATVSSKRQLVPFGEYLPMQALFSRARALAAEAGEFVPGDRIVLHGVRGQRVACLVCYEAVFPELSAEAVEAGADLLVNMTNDSWFGWTSGPRQHLMHSLLRAAETGRPLVRAANSGISVIVGADGRVVERLDLGRRGVIVADVRVGGRPAPGFRVGGWLAVGCATLSVVALGAAWLPWRSRRRRRTGRRTGSQNPRTEPDRPGDRDADA